MRTFLFTLLLLSMGSTSVGAQADFYKGKTVKLIIGYSAGGTNDLWARAIARFWGKYIPGNPNFIVQNMPGAATMIAANYIYGVEKGDGLTLGLIAPALFFNQLGGQKEAKFDWAKFAWIGTPEETSEMLPCVPTRLSKLSTIFARHRRHPSAAPPVPARRATIFRDSWKKFSRSNSTW